MLDYLLKYTGQGIEGVGVIVGGIENVHPVTVTLKV